MKLIALSSSNQKLDDAKKKTREEWQRWGARRLTENERKLGWVCIVGQFESDELGSYFRVNYAAMPIDRRPTAPKRIY